MTIPMTATDATTIPPIVPLEIPESPSVASLDAVAVESLEEESFVEASPEAVGVDDV